MSTENHDQDARRSRGKGFPLVPLQEAADYVAEAARYGMSHHINAFAQYLGHSKPSGGAFNNKIAAIRDWGLITRVGTTVTLTELAQRLALPTDESQHDQDLREAFFACAIFREAYERNAKGQPLAIDAFGNGAVLNLGVAVSARDRFVRSFVKSAVAAGLAEERPNGTFALKQLALEAQSDAPTDAPPPESSGARDEAPAQTALPAPRAGLRPAFRQTWEFDGGQLDISIALAQPLARRAYAHIAVAMAELIELIESSGSEEQAAST